MGKDRVAELAMVKRIRFSYTPNEGLRTFHTIGVGSQDTVEVVGDGDNASYEWVIRTPSGVAQHSDCGYGMPEVALRDGLIAYLGLPSRGTLAFSTAVPPCNPWTPTTHTERDKG